MNSIIDKNQVKISKIATIIIFLALIRCISEPFRLEYYATTNLTFAEAKLFLVGALIAGIALLAMTILVYYAKYKATIATSILTIILLFVVKGYYGIN
jgi:hypothetical protein